MPPRATTSISARVWGTASELQGTASPLLLHCFCCCNWRNCTKHRGRQPSLIHPGADRCTGQQSPASPARPTSIVAGKMRAHPANPCRGNKGYPLRQWRTSGGHQHHSLSLARSPSHLQLRSLTTPPPHIQESHHHDPADHRRKVNTRRSHSPPSSTTSTTPHTRASHRRHASHLFHEAVAGSYCTPQLCSLSQHQY